MSDYVKIIDKHYILTGCMSDIIKYNNSFIEYEYIISYPYYKLYYTVYWDKVFIGSSSKFVIARNCVNKRKMPV